MSISLDDAYKQALRFAKSHYENFPVVSLFLPKRLRKHVAVVYKFARQADDLADEGNIKPGQRLVNLYNYEKNLNRCLNNGYDNSFWEALGNTINEFNLTGKHFIDLLSAFKQDVEKIRYETFDEVLNYCEHSANPVGRIILEFFDIRDPDTLSYSDAVCTALQLTNFLQDTAIDYKKGRIYIPLEDLRKYEIDEIVFNQYKDSDSFRDVLKFQEVRIREMFENGKNLIPHLPKEIKKQIKWTILGGEKILDKIEKIDYSVLNFRPTLSKYDYIKLMFKAI